MITWRQSSELRKSLDKYQGKCPQELLSVVWPLCSTIPPGWFGRKWERKGDKKTHTKKKKYQMLCSASEVKKWNWLEIVWMEFLFYFLHLNHYLTNPTINPKLLYKQLGEEPGSAKICLTFSRRLVPEFRSLCPQIIFPPVFCFFLSFYCVLWYVSTDLRWHTVCAMWAERRTTSLFTFHLSPQWLEVFESCSLL